MRLVVQRVTRATVDVEEECVAEIGAGALVLAGIAAGDDASVVDRMAEKLARLRYFEDEDGRTNRDITDVGGSLLVVSQFTLLADTRRGRRPGFSAAAAPEVAEPLVERFADHLRSAGLEVASGRFRAAMEVELVNDGPFTLVIDSGERAGHTNARVG
jgi:D-tyrosyl-tRNA(Tyr) deacylase